MKKLLYTIAVWAMILGFMVSCGSHKENDNTVNENDSIDIDTIMIEEIDSIIPMDSIN